MSSDPMIKHLARVTGLPDGRLTLRPKEAARSLGISARKMDDLVRSRRIPAFKIDNCWLIPVEDLKRWIAEQSHGS